MKFARLTQLIIIVSFMLTGCVNLAPDYVQPSAPVAATWSTEQIGDAPAASVKTISVDQIGWKEFYGDKRLNKLIELALNNNRNLRQSALAVESARAQFRIARADTLPAVNAVGSNSLLRTSGQASRTYSATLGISAFELDFFGRLNNLRDQALETYLSFEESLRSMRITLVAEVATAYFTLAADQQSLRLAERTLESQQKSLDLTLKTFEIGTASGLDVATAQTSVDTARADIAIARTQVAQDINALTLLIGQPIDPALVTNSDSQISDPLAPLIQTISPVADAPSELLQRRPDILAAERSLRAANASIGAARAARFPNIILTTSAGTTSGELSDLFSGGSGLWSFNPSISLPIFDSGSRKANVRIAELTHDTALAEYELAIQTAFREVSDALSEQSNIQELIAARLSLLKANEKIFRLTEASFRSGLESSLLVLTAQQSHTIAQQDMISARLTEALNWVTLYRVLGGGWK